MDMIVTKNLTRKYGEKTAVDNLSLTVGEGELFALLGVNGAGKTTTIRMLSCLSKPTSGEAFVDGHSCTGESRAVKQVIGLSPQDTAVADHLTVRENLEFMAAVYGCSKQEVKQRTDRIIGDFHLGEVEQLKGKMTIVLTTHYMEEAEHLSDRIAIMVSGRIAAAGSLAEILATGGADNLEDAFVSIAEKEGIA